MGLPYIRTHQDADGTEVITTVAHDLLMISAAGKSMWTCPPTGPEAVAFAKAILAAAGDTGHVVVEEAQIARQFKAEAGIAAQSMRDRAARTVMAYTDGLDDLAGEVEDLPLFPDVPRPAPLTADTDA